MQLTLRSDYALRVLVYLSTHPDRIVTTQEISSAYGISKHHLVRVIQTLAEQQHVKIYPGRSGGVKLAREPHKIRLGDVLQAAEPNLRLVECFDKRTNTCPISSVCALKGILNEGLVAFVNTLNRYTIADVIQSSNQRKLANIFATVTWQTR